MSEKMKEEGGQCAICKINQRGVPCPKQKKLDEKMFVRIQNWVEEQEKNRVHVQKIKIF